MRLRELVGQRGAVRHFQVAIAAAHRRGEPLPHTLLCGGPGVGKTTLAAAVAAEMGALLHRASAPAINDPGTLIGLLGSLREGDILFLDEIHRLLPRVAEILYEAMDERRLNLPLRWEGLHRTMTLRLAPFSLIGATSQEELLPPPLFSRFGICRRLEFYSRRELSVLLERCARRQGVALRRQAARILARASRDTPREGLALLRSAIDEATAAGCDSIDAGLAEAALRRAGVDPIGLCALERQYLATLRAGRRPLGLATLAGRLGISREALRSVHEPFLLRRGLIVLTPMGRALATSWRN